MSDRCEICGKTIHPANTYVEQVYGKTLELCMHCSTMVTSASGVNANNKLIGRKYLKGKLDETALTNTILELSECSFVDLFGSFREPPVL